ncbi:MULTISPECIES: SH3 domain-containing protein [unclassified Variovorax]|jgi:uncharacterized protein YraI|uniref:SH3 domain-containing protein n=1 Tax=unclassified Variovorax TaxID=663243 RepID=UPI000F7E6A68|nr:MULTISPECIES: SH3 domain-containing protein [unclassified Variovorax]RSZ30902.1 ligand-binding protein SH3 [Variovorax sp. 553]RSZ31516.1 ligand-binding protein SH3 [Variovorax sp. 679]
MNSFVLHWLGIAALALALPIAAQAQQAFTRGAVNLRAGPSGDYPLVARLGPGQPLEVVGCTSGYGWCDVVLPDGGRGWIWARNLDYAYQEQRVPLVTYGALIGVPIIGFAIGSYWADYYRDRPWYGDRRWWGNRPPPPPMAGWRPTPPVRPGWQPHPWRPGPGFRPTGPGFRPPPPPGIRPPVDPGIRPPRPRPEFRPGPPPGVPHPHPGGGRGHREGGRGEDRGGGHGGGHRH